MATSLSQDQVREALSRVDDPEIGKPITELDMVESIAINGADVSVGVYLTIAACPMRDTIASNTRAVLEELDGVGSVDVHLHTMSDEQRRALSLKLRGEQTTPMIPFADPESLTRVFAVASGKGGVGKSSVTVNLATSLAAQGLTVGILDADIYGHSVPRLMGSTGISPTVVDEMIMPPIAHDVRHISVGQFVEGNAPIVWRGPMLTRAIQQFLSDVYWGDLDVLFMDLPPGTGDVAITVAQLVPNAELLIVTTPQAAAAEVAERAGTISQQTGQKIAGVVENMSGMVLDDGTVLNVFGEGGGEQVAERLSALTDTDNVALLGSVPLDPQLRQHGDEGTPVVISNPDSPAARAIAEIAAKLKTRRTSLVGKGLGVNPR
ncbi:Mrp/NBP35 family ATP-binding protein [Corynebacterium sanguinis]|uniref:Mrp/NBP35 family ATP-binding protein n=1 Tax=Corynebacterium sanguinis TaxID=2594913 RepID=UPI0010AB1EE5|nr:Mrp/NBP35 family ATP-binding protein [Corynebacterium sanguinis]MCT1414005.1 Mrp/NBP35 family ATP-binding protein [Corynebacterium sanguinis]MCT1498884.1 Mrp/NBP35 family ATP-binding protein [Corynebacterium sanguinis]MCT1555990.1 Mrp/NBP35 family ATP-binding protein [Corynebacterium sanguinis]MCT1584264.1 Mrp/NBP35 family ATP-binding protein [Corynebacterium sanguinis]MCT1613411.1 Mrp/NBP35 family ATP-binding protein [Corynebacterium sanguinis]